MKFFLIACVLLTLFSCKSKNQQLIEKVDPIIRQLVYQDSIVAKIDSIKIYKIDTLNDLRYNQQSLANSLAKSTFYLEMAKNYSNEAALDKQSVDLQLQQYKLYVSFLHSKVLNDVQHDDVIRALNTLKETTGKMKLYSDSGGYIIKKIKKIQDNIRNKKYNTKSFRGYVVLFKLLGSDKKNMEVKKDSLNCFLSPSFRVIPANKM